MKTFAFLLHPLNTHQVKSFWPLTRILPSFFIKSYLRHRDFKILPFKKIKSKKQGEIQGYLIVCPLLAQEIEELMRVNEEFLFDKIISAGSIAEHLGAGIMGLGGYLGIVADKKPMIYKHLKLPVSSGSAFTAWSIFEAVFKLVKEKDWDIKRLNLAQIGPITAVSSLCSRKFSGHVGKIILSGESEEKLLKLKSSLNHLNSLQIQIEQDVSEAVKEADIIINTNSQASEVFNITHLRRESIVCDASVLQIYVKKLKQRKDITLIEGRMIKLPNAESGSLNLGLDQELIYPSMAEVMLLALEERLVNYSLGENINIDKLEDIADMAVQHGFEICLPSAMSTE